ncbi:hypothetical protein P3T25_005743 [Paraburkholderia sp. GAS32]|jgi:hypothetical protein
MRFVSIFVRIALIVGVFLAGRDALAGPVRCSVNNQDSTCVGHLTTAWQTAPTCPNQPGWTTVASAQWIGSQYSAPQCNYQAPPSCPPGRVEAVPPSWNGSAWVGQACQIPSAPQNVCPYGFASGPVWNGSTWIYSCNSAPTVTCASEAQSQGYTLTNGYGISGPFTGYYTKFDGSYGYGTYNQVKYGANGPVWNDVCANTGTAYILYCSVSPTDGSVLGQLTGYPNGAQSASECSGVN